MAKWQKGQSGNLADRKKGSKNKTTVAKEYAHDEAGKRRMLPLAYMLKVMRDPKADSAAPLRNRGLSLDAHPAQELDVFRCNGWQ